MLTAKVKKNPNSKTLEKLAKHINELKNTKLKFGYFDDSGNHSQSNRSGEPIPYSALMAWHELGLGDYPARPLLTIAQQLAQDDFVSGKYTKITKSVISDVGNNSLHVNRLASDIRDDMKSVFGSDYLQGNSESTILNKGFDSPLEETGELRDNFGYKINNEGVVK